MLCTILHYGERTGRVYLDIIEEQVTYAAWERICERARRVVKQWKPRPLALGWRQIGDVRVAQSVLDVETEYGRCMIGDAETRTTGEGLSVVVDAERVRSVTAALPRTSRNSYGLHRRQLRYRVDGLGDHSNHVVIAGRQPPGLFEALGDLQGLAQQGSGFRDSSEFVERDAHVALG
jgi:hypothetical protein